ncbi:hypothetical protein A2U01_0088351, partial [Trifolium medium]|nr:hypothetical protein [Trifolium medium]
MDKFLNDDGNSPKKNLVLCCRWRKARRLHGARRRLNVDEAFASAVCARRA